MVLPGFQDVHIHPIDGGMQAVSFCDLSASENLEQYLEVIAKYAAAHPDEAWIRGGGWLMSAFPSAIPSREALDRIVPDRPVYLTSSDGHSAWVNTKALEAAGITRDTPDPVDGRIDRNPETGEPVGALQEGAMDLVRLPPESEEQRRNGLRYALKLLNGYGITGFQEAMARAVELETYADLDERGELTARVVAALWWERDRGEEQVAELVAKREQFTKGRLRATSVKIMQDGVMENHTAALLEPYLGMPDERGISMLEPGLLKQVVTRLDREGFQVHFHAIGDGAIRQSLDAIEAARSSNGNRENRHHISHIQLFDPADIPRFRQLGVIANFQPLWAYADPYITELTIPFLGEERSRWLYPIGSLLRSGAVVAFGSDWNVSTPDPFDQIEVALTRMASDGGDEKPLLPDERIDLPSALAAFTINAAYVNGMEDRTGSIEVGKLADLVVVDRNLFEIDPSEISEATAVLTLLGGEPVHGDFAF
jgi:predicted amidohydrolase YtcJ